MHGITKNWTQLSMCTRTHTHTHTHTHTQFSKKVKKQKMLQSTYMQIIPEDI